MTMKLCVQIYFVMGSPGTVQSIYYVTNDTVKTMVMKYVHHHIWSFSCSADKHVLPATSYQSCRSGIDTVGLTDFLSD